MASQDIAAGPLEVSRRTQTHDVVLVDGIGKLSKDEQHITTASLAHDSEVAAPRANFPLPRELRDHIYNYLLDAEHTRVRRAHDGGRAYKFHTNILRVNRQIHDEAEEYLYKHNIFVVIGHQFLDGDFFSFALQALWVAQLRENEFVHCTLDVRFSKVLNVKSEQSETPRSESYWVILSKDLDFFCRVMSPILVTCCKDAPKLLINDDGSVLDHPVHGDDQQLSSYHMGIRFCSHRYLKTSCVLQASLLVPLRTLVRPGLSASISGQVSDHNHSQSFKASNLVCGSAVIWDLLEVLHGVKVTADVSALAGEFEIAAHLYGKAARALSALGSNMMWPAPDINLALYSLLINTLLSKSNLHKHGKDPTRFAQTIARLLQVTGPVPDGDSGPVASCIFHEHMLAVTLTPSDDVLPPFTRVTIAECIDRLSRHMSYHQAHDVAILKMCADQKKIFTPEDLPVASCSFFATTTRVIRSNLPFSKPDHILGLVNMVQLRSLDKGQRKRINDLQMEHGWDITRFEEYDEAGSRSEAA